MMVLIINIHLKNIYSTRYTFSLGLQPTTLHKFIYWHATRMPFLQCSLTGTALCWYIRLNDTYKQDWSAFAQLFNKQCLLKRMPTIHRLKP